MIKSIITTTDYYHCLLTPQLFWIFNELSGLDNRKPRTKNMQSYIITLFKGGNESSSIKDMRSKVFQHMLATKGWKYWAFLRYLRLFKYAAFAPTRGAFWNPIIP